MNLGGWTERNSDLRRGILQSADCDILCLCETHLVGDQNIVMTGYKWFGYNRQALHIRAPKGSGGVGILVRDEICISYNVRVVDKSHEGIIGLQLQHKVSDYTIIVYACYLAPENSPWGRDALSFYSHLLSQTYINNDTDAIICCGDFNSRIGKINDCITDIDMLPERACLDETVNTHGTSLIEFLQESKFCVLNGRVANSNDEFTCRTARGVSVVDYFIVPHDIFPQCKNLNVKSCNDIVDECGLHNMLNDRSRIPDHALLTCHLTINVITDVNDNEKINVSHLKSHRRYDFKKINGNFMKSDLCKMSLQKLIQNIECNRELQTDVDNILN